MKPVEATRAGYLQKEAGPIMAALTALYLYNLAKTGWRGARAIKSNLKHGETGKLYQNALKLGTRGVLDAGLSMLGPLKPVGQVSKWLRRGGFAGGIGAYMTKGDWVDNFKYSRKLTRSSLPEGWEAVADPDWLPKMRERIKQYKASTR